MESRIVIDKKHGLGYGESREEICPATEAILLFEIVSPEGKLTREEPAFAIVVSATHIHAIAVGGGQLKRVRKVSQSHPVRSAALMPWGTILVRTDKAVRMISIPDASYSPIMTQEIREGERVVFVQGQGFVLVGERSLKVFLKEPVRTPIYDPEVEVIVEPPPGLFQSMLGAKNPTLQDADEGFKHRRKKPPRAAAAGNMEQTQQMMQQILVTAQERGEVLSEMQIKADQLRDGAKNFAALARSLNGK
jgi:hypothetical protein